MLILQKCKNQVQQLSALRKVFEDWAGNPLYKFEQVWQVKGWM
jgi:hypothetical protein